MTKPKAEPDAGLTDRLRHVRVRLAALKEQLDEFGYVFERPEEALATPHSEVERILNRLRSSIGPVPACIVTFWCEVGSVDFRGHHPDWRGCDYPDPIVVDPPTSAESELEEYLNNEDAYVNAFGSFRIPIAPDHKHKQGVSGGMWYGIALPDARVDVPLLEERHNTTFLAYLDTAIQWGGFPGLEKIEGEHNWPIDQLKRFAP